MAGHGQKKDRRWEPFIIGLLCRPTIPEAAHAAGISERLGYRLLKDAAFLRDYQQARAALLQQTIGYLSGTAGHMVQVLRQVALDPEAASSARVSAARSVLELLVRIEEVTALRAEIEVLRCMIEEQRR